MNAGAGFASSVANFPLHPPIGNLYTLFGEHLLFLESLTRSRSLVNDNVDGRSGFFGFEMNRRVLRANKETNCACRVEPAGKKASIPLA